MRVTRLIELVFDQVEKFTCIPDKMKGDNVDLIKTLEVNVKSKLCAVIRWSSKFLNASMFLTQESAMRVAGKFLTIGSVGTGKTELVKLLSSNLDMKLIKYDMSEYGERHSVSSLIVS